MSVSRADVTRSCTAIVQATNQFLRTEDVAPVTDWLVATQTLLNEAAEEPPVCAADRDAVEALRRVLDGVLEVFADTTAPATDDEVPGGPVGSERPELN